ncbi:hypothetical protein KVH07_21305 [Streptomyces olivaceus]|uniref:hypothetical protein n=1 Tax=Streptomyces olivaceus TaxID=47716 RepID=UPI001CCE3997|nr:hypothetical protein [Streptomyces olivaceus]MBZ6195442.1 hypothetical protein [Streptomyces olivaceus]
MSSSIIRLSRLATPALSTDMPLSVPRRLVPLISERNGFHAFESALHVFRWGGGDMSAEWWNSPSLWRGSYGDSFDELTFFAEDAFGFQFAVSDVGFHSFNPETGEVESMGRTSEEWARQIIDDFEVLTGHPVIREWQQSNGALRPGFRLSPRTPFVLGGQFSVKTMRSVDSVDLMRFRADLYRQLVSIPDGSQVAITMGDKE